MAKSFTSDGYDIGKHCSQHHFSCLDVHYNVVNYFQFPRVFIALNREESLVLRYSHDVSTFETFFNNVFLILQSINCRVPSVEQFSI